MAAFPSLPPTPQRLTWQEALASARETRALALGNGTLGEVVSIFRAQFPGQRAILVADPQTLRLAGTRVRADLAAAGLEGAPPLVIEDPSLYAEHRFVTQVEDTLRSHAFVPVAVGAGTLNDLVKLAAHRTDRAYLCVATAASMDGYTAFGASITFEGAKQTFECPAPRAVIADIDVIRRAPPEMTASGYADLMAKVTAGADWIMADALGAEPIEPRAWAIVQGGLRDALADPAGARAGANTAITPLVEGLMLGGFAMQWSKSSRPASGAEHQFSHLWDMEHHVHRGEAPSHGFKVGLATLAVSEFYAVLLRRPLDQLDVDRLVAAWPDADTAEAETRRMFHGEEFLPVAVRETRAKHATREELTAQLTRLREGWPRLRERLRHQLLAPADIAARLRAVGAPVKPEEIGITRARLRASFTRARHIRRRFTVLDLAQRAGIFESVLDELFQTGGPWPLTQP